MQFQAYLHHKIIDDLSEIQITGTPYFYLLSWAALPLIS